MTGFSARVFFTGELFDCFKRLENTGQILLKDDTETFEEIALPSLDVVYRTAVALSGRRQEADDLVQ